MDIQEKKTFLCMDEEIVNSKSQNKEFSQECYEKTEIYFCMMIELFLFLKVNNQLEEL